MNLARTTSLNSRRCSGFRRSQSVSKAAVRSNRTSLAQRREKGLAVVVRRHATGCEILIGLALACLPSVSPEPGLTRGNRNLRSKLDHAVLTLSHLNLRPG